VDLSAITDQIYVGSRPASGDGEALRRLDPTLVISMLGGAPPASVQALGRPVLILPTRDNLLLPIPIRRLEQGVETALPVVRSGGRVLVYCRLGRHRSVALAVCLLIALGWSSDDAADLVQTKRAQADPRAWHIWRRIRAFERAWAVRPPA
jgi:hypothetical protein